MTITCPECSAEVDVPVSVRLLGGGMGPQGKYRIGVMPEADRTAVDAHAATHNITEGE